MKKKTGPQGLVCPQPRGSIHVYNHNIQISSSLKLLGQSMSRHCVKNNPGHMTKMAIYGKNPPKIFSGTSESFAMKLTCSDWDKSTTMSL